MSTAARTRGNYRQCCCRHPSYNELQASCKKLSAATQVVDNLKKELVEEQQRRGAADRDVERTAGRLADLKRAMASGSGSEAVASLRQEAAKLRDLVNTTLPKCAPNACSPDAPLLGHPCSTKSISQQISDPIVVPAGTFFRCRCETTRSLL